MAAGWLFALIYGVVVKPDAMREKIVGAGSRSTKFRLLSLFLLSILVALALPLYRHHRMTELYKKALRGQTSDADSAMRELGNFHGEESADLLLRLASPTSRFVDNRQTVAVQILARRNNATVTARLAESLKPYSSLSLRKDVSQALLETDCNFVCIQSVLHYLERLSCRELNVEEAFERNSDFRSGLKAEQDEIVRRLLQVLSKDQDLTKHVLTSEYGLGTDYPSRFGVEIAGSAQIKSACPLLDNSSSKAFDGALREQIYTVMQQLRCPASTHRNSNTQ